MGRTKSLQYQKLAKQFLAEHPHEFVVWRQFYWRFVGSHYEQFIGRDYFQLFLLKWASDKGITDNPHMVRNIEANIHSQIMLSPHQAVPAFLGETTPRRFIVTLQDGLLDLSMCREGGEPTLQPNTYKWFSPTCLPFQYDPAADCPEWLEFLDVSLEGDQERIAILQEWFGYCCVYDTSFEKALFVEGPGANGKSQMIEVLQQLVGVNNCSSIPLESFGARFQLTPSFGKLVNVATETAPYKRVDTSLLRSFITGEDVLFEYKGKDPFKARATARLVIAMNEGAALHDYSEAIWRRLLLMPWTHTVPPQERVLDLGKKIASRELPGIFNWAIEGLKRLWKQREFTRSAVVEEALQGFRNERDPTRQALLEILIPDESGPGITVTELWNTYAQYCHDNGVACLCKRSADLIRALKRLFPSVQKRGRIYVDGTKSTVWTGIRLRQTPVSATPSEKDHEV